MGIMPLLMAWFAPALGSDRDCLAYIIDRLAAEYNTPQFEPHVTMVATSEVDEEAAARTLSSLMVGVPPFDMTFIAFGHEQTYFRSLYLRAEPSPQLTVLREAVREAWALDLPPYMPHLSLLYSDFTAEQKSSIIDTIEIQLPLTIHIDTVELWADDLIGGVDNWRCVHRVPLGNQAPDLLGAN